MAYFRAKIHWLQQHKQKWLDSWEQLINWSSCRLFAFLSVPFQLLNITQSVQ